MNDKHMRFTMTVKEGQRDIAQVIGTMTLLGDQKDDDQKVLQALFNAEQAMNEPNRVRAHISLDEFPANATM